jgi:hypothetical protein
VASRRSVNRGKNRNGLIARNGKTEDRKELMPDRARKTEVFRRHRGRGHRTSHSTNLPENRNLSAHHTLFFGLRYTDLFGRLRPCRSRNHFFLFSAEAAIVIEMINPITPSDISVRIT